MARGDNPGVMGRPKLPIDWDEVDQLCKIQCTRKEIAAFCECSEDTLERRCKEEKDCTFAAYFDEKSQGGKRSLRRRQYLLADAGDKTMLVWLGKQWLSQEDKSSVRSENTHRIQGKKLHEYTTEELTAAYEAEKAKE